jgi:cytochrome b6-f complex iron-sulfur subunit
MDETPPTPDDVDRREFLSWTWKALGTVLVVEAAWTTYDLLNPKSAGGFGGVVEAGGVSEFPEGAVRYFQNGKFYVTSVESELHALYQKCPHLGCRVPFCSTSRRFECPCHGSKFNLAGEYIEGPTPRGMDRFPVTIDGDKVLVDTGDVLEGPPRGVQTVPSEAAGPSCLGEPAGASTDGEGAP